MQSDAPEVFLQFLEWGEQRAIPFPKFYLSDDQAFFDFCVSNSDTTLEFEREPDGEVRLMPPSGSETGRVNGYILAQLFNWNELMNEPGYVFDASSGFLLPNRAIRAPDIAYIEKSRYDRLTKEEREHHAPLAPDFIVEVMSPTDRLARLQAKMNEYCEVGVRLSWLIDRKNHTVHVYRPRQPIETLIEAVSISADPELPGFVLSLARLFSTSDT